MDDRNAIIELRYRYALGIDTRDWALFRAVFADALDVDFASLAGQPGQRMSAAEWVAAAATLFGGLDATQHLVTNPIVAIDGDRATLVSYVHAWHFLDGREWQYGGCFRDELVNMQAGWRIAAMTLTVLWRRGDEALLRDAARTTARREVARTPARRAADAPGRPGSSPRR